MQPQRRDLMEDVYENLIGRLYRQLAEKRRSGHGRLIIALAGPPGSGKTTIAKEVARRISATPDGPSLVVISADGFHLPLSALRALPNAGEALARRGAPWTFDGGAVAGMVNQLRNDAGKKVVYAPTFDHAIKDPVANGICVGVDIEVCIVEGNYLLVNEAPWNAIAGVVDDRWLVEVDPALAKNRISKRHLQAGIEVTMEDAIWRAESNDLVNGQYVIQHSTYDVLVRSVDES